MKAVNLIPGEQRKGSGGLSDLTGRSGGAALIVLGVVVGLAVMIAMYGGAHHSISSQKGEVAQIKAEASVVEARTGRLTPYTNFVSMADQRTQTVAQLVQARFDWSHVLRELGRVLPPGTSLSAVHGTVGAAGTTPGATASTTAAAGATAASSTPPGSTPVFTLTGCATSQSVVAQALQRLRLMDGASEVQLQSSTKPETGGGGGGATGGCPGTDASFTTQVTFVGLPAAPATSSPTTAAGAAAASTHSAGASVPVSAGGASK